MPTTSDWIALGIFAVFAVLGLIIGFGKGLKFFTGGVFGAIISLIVCYFAYGIVVNWTFVQDLLNKLIEAIAAAQNGFCDFLLKIHIEVIVLCVSMFIIVQLIRIIIVAIIKNIVEIDNVVVKVINKILGMFLMLSIAAMLGLISLQIIYWVGGQTAEQVREAFNGSVFKLDWLFENNPLNMIFEYFKQQPEQTFAFFTAI